MRHVKEDSKIDAKEISRKVREYFYEVHGQYAVIGFRIESVEPHTKGWQVKCSFYLQRHLLKKKGYIIKSQFPFQAK